MKKHIIIILGLFTASVLIAATLTIEVPANDVPRVSEAFGSILNLGRNATVTEVQEATRRWLIDSTKDYERRKNTYTYSPTPMEMQPTPTPGQGARIAAPKPTATPTSTPKSKKK